MAAEIASLATCRTSSRRSRRSTPTTAMPRMIENSTTAGTTLFASELNGFAGMYRSMKSNGGSPLDEARAEERRALNRGKGQRDQERERERHEPQAANHRRGAQAQRPQLGRPERAETGDDRDGDVGQHHHLEQLDETVGRPLQRRRPLAEEHPGEDASASPARICRENVMSPLAGEQQESHRHGTDGGRGKRSSITVIRKVTHGIPSSVTRHHPECARRARRPRATYVVSAFRRTRFGPAKAGHHVHGDTKK